MESLAHFADCADLFAPPPEDSASLTTSEHPFVQLLRFAYAAEDTMYDVFPGWKRYPRDTRRITIKPVASTPAPTPADFDSTTLTVTTQTCLPGPRSPSPASTHVFSVPSSAPSSPAPSSPMYVDTDSEDDIELFYTTNNDPETTESQPYLPRSPSPLPAEYSENFRDPTGPCSLRCTSPHYMPESPNPSVPFPSENITYAGDVFRNIIKNHGDKTWQEYYGENWETYHSAIVMHTLSGLTRSIPTVFVLDNHNWLAADVGVITIDRITGLSEVRSTTQFFLRETAALLDEIVDYDPSCNHYTCGINYSVLIIGNSSARVGDTRIYKINNKI